MGPRVLRGAELPHRLADMVEPPESVFLWGELPPEPYVAIVGSRRASAEALDFVTRLASELSERGVTVISGGARGIDAAAHEGALRAGARTLVVAPCGLDKPYPAEHKELFRRVVERGGGYLSLSADEQGARREHFHRRNAVLAGLCHALVLGEAHFKSGGRNAVKHARLAGRAVFAVPAAPWNPLGSGCNLELRAGARWLEGARDVLRFLEESGQLPTSARERTPRSPKDPKGSPKGRGRQLALPALAPTAPASAAFDAQGSAHALEVVGRAVEAGEVHVDGICERTGLGAGAVSAALLELTLMGRVFTDAGGRLRSRGKSQER